jgi:hypothetical protein
MSRKNSAAEQLVSGGALGRFGRDFTFDPRDFISQQTDSGDEVVNRDAGEILADLMRRLSQRGRFCVFEPGQSALLTLRDARPDARFPRCTRLGDVIYRLDPRHRDIGQGSAASPAAGGEEF